MEDNRTDALPVAASRRSDIIRSQSKIIDSLFRALSKRVTAEELDQMSVIEEIEKTNRMIREAGEG